MSKIFALIALLVALVFAKEPNFDPSSVHTFELKKDEWARVFITEKRTQRVKRLTFAGRYLIVQISLCKAFLGAIQGRWSFR